MDLWPVVESLVQEMEWDEVVSTLETVIYDLLRDGASNTPPPPVHAGPNVHPHLDNLFQGQACVLEQQTFLNAASTDTQLSHKRSQTETASQGQYRYDVPSMNVSMAAAEASPGHTFNAPVVKLPDNIDLVSFIEPNGELSYRLVMRPPPSAAPLLTSTTSSKRKRRNQPEPQTYIKKPRNAFMLFVKEERPKVSAEMGIRNSAAVNAEVGQRWRSLSHEQQAKYFEEAEAERRLHAQQYPNWSCEDNYGKKRKRVT